VVLEVEAHDDLHEKRIANGFSRLSKKPNPLPLDRTLKIVYIISVRKEAR